MPRVIRRTERRRGATAVEMAFVLLIALLFIFGIFEYGRFLYFLEVTENAAREGARFAACNTGRAVQVGSAADTATPTTVTLPNGMIKVYFNADTEPASPPSIRAVVNHYMNGMQAGLSSYNVNCFGADTNGNNVGAWNTTQFAGGYIAVQVTGNYQFMAAQLLGFSGTVPINIKVLQTSEAN